MNPDTAHEPDLAGLKIGLMLNDGFSMLHFRGGLIRHLRGRGAHVVAMVPPGEYTAALEALGVDVEIIPMQRFIAPLRDLKTIWDIRRVLRQRKFDILHTMTIKPNIYGAFAARMAGVPVVVGLVSGAGAAFGGERHLKARLLETVTSLLYRSALKLHRKVWFQNPDDADEFVARRLLPRAKAIVIRSGGINTDEFSRATMDVQRIAALRRELGIAPDKKCVVMIAARMIWSKGVREFVGAAEALRDLTGWHFVMLCPWDESSPDSVDPAFIDSCKLDNLTIISKFRTDVKDFAGLAEIGVLPSYYREGVPRSLLEFLALGAPIVTTNSIGCREVVTDGVNGYLVPVKDAAALARALRRLMENDALRQSMGVASRALALSEFSETSVASRVVRDVYECGRDAE